MVIVIPGIIDGTVVDIAVGKKRNKISIVFVAGSLSSAEVPAAIPKKLKKKHQTKQSKHTRDDGKGFIR